MRVYVPVLVKVCEYVCLRVYTYACIRNHNSSRPISLLPISFSHDPLSFLPESTTHFFTCPSWPHIHFDIFSSIALTSFEVERRYLRSLLNHISISQCVAKLDFYLFHYPRCHNCPFISNTTILKCKNNRYFNVIGPFLCGFQNSELLHTPLRLLLSIYRADRLTPGFTYFRTEQSKDF